jgi:hypothetical protein
MIRISRSLVGPVLFGMLSAASLAQEPGEWEHRAELLAPNSEFAVAEPGGRLYVLGAIQPTGRR